jgi:preprotein translocase subunit SecE
VKINEYSREICDSFQRELTASVILITMKKIKTYIKESYNELVHKVSWPTWSQLQSSAIVVMIGSVVLALIVLVMDLAFKNGMSFIYEMLY